MTNGKLWKMENEKWLRAKIGLFAWVTQMRLIVCIKQVPEVAEIKFNPDTNTR